MKPELLEYLRNKTIEDINDMWSLSKSFFKKRGIKMGGSYASFNDFISVHLLNNGLHERFRVSILEINNKNNNE